MTWHSATPNWHCQLLHCLLGHSPFRNAGTPAYRDFHIYLTPQAPLSCCPTNSSKLFPSLPLTLTPLPSSATCTRAHWQPTLWQPTLWQPTLWQPTLWHTTLWEPPLQEPPLRLPTLRHPTLWHPPPWQPTQPFTTAASEVIIRNMHWRYSGLQHFSIVALLHPVSNRHTISTQPAFGGRLGI